MTTWFFGYGNDNGLINLEEDPLNLSVDLFYDEEVKKNISDDYKKKLWTLAHKARTEANLNGCWFKALIPDNNIQELKDLKETDPRAAMILVEKYAVSIELGIHGIPVSTMIDRWAKITESEPVQLSPEILEQHGS